MKDLFQYTIQQQPIGEGAYGEVYKGVCSQTGETIALKKTRIENMNDGILSTTMREISILTELEHKNIVSLKDVIMTDRYIYFVQEYCNLDLRNYLLSLPEHFRLSANEIKDKIFQILEGVRECHENRILHRDLKPANILLSGDLNQYIKLADFGLARAFSIPIKPYTKDVVTLWYRSPELLLSYNEYATPIDIWSVGCIFAELAMKDALFKGQNEPQQLLEIFRILGTPTEETWPGVTSQKGFRDTKWPLYGGVRMRDFIGPDQIDDLGIDLLQKMLEYDPTKRITAQKALEHAYFN